MTGIVILKQIANSLRDKGRLKLLLLEYGVVVTQTMHFYMPNLKRCSGIICLNDCNGRF